MIERDSTDFMIKVDIFKDLELKNKKTLPFLVSNTDQTPGISLLSYQFPVNTRVLKKSLRRLLYVMDVSKTSQRRLVLTGLKGITNNEKEFVFFNQV